MSDKIPTVIGQNVRTFFNYKDVFLKTKIYPDHMWYTTSFLFHQTKIETKSDKRPRNKEKLFAEAAKTMGRSRTCCSNFFSTLSEQYAKHSGYHTFTLTTMLWVSQNVFHFSFVFKLKFLSTKQYHDIKIWRRYYQQGTLPEVTSTKHAVEWLWLRDQLCLVPHLQQENLMPLN